MYGTLARRSALACVFLTTTALAQTPPPPPPAPPSPPPQTFVPFTVDLQKWLDLGRELDNISMPAAAYRQVIAVLQNLEYQAQLEAAAKTRAAEPPKAAEPKAAPKGE